MISGEDIIAMQQEVRDIHVEDSILEYVTALATATREHELIRLGVSPRGALAIVRMAKAERMSFRKMYSRFLPMCVPIELF